MMMIPCPLQNLNMLFQKLLISSSKHYPVSDLNVLSSFDEEKKIGRATILQLQKPMVYSLLLLKLQSSPLLMKRRDNLLIHCIDRNIFCLISFIYMYILLGLLFRGFDWSLFILLSSCTTFDLLLVHILYIIWYKNLMNLMLLFCFILVLGLS